MNLGFGEPRAGFALGLPRGIFGVTLQWDASPRTGSQPNNGVPAPQWGRIPILGYQPHKGVPPTAQCQLLVRISSCYSLSMHGARGG